MEITTKKWTPIVDAHQTSPWEVDGPHKFCTVKVICPYCGETHMHGHNIDESNLSHRASHCGEPEHPVLQGGYYMQFIEIKPASEIKKESK